MAMDSKKEIKKEELTVKEVEQNVEQAENEQPAEQEETKVKEKKKFDWKGFGKKVGLGAAAVAGIGMAFLGGYEVGSHSKKDGSGDSQQSAPDAGSNQTEDSAE